MAGKIYKLMANVPVSGVLKQAYYAPTRTEGYGDQIKVIGNFDGDVGQATIYLPIGAAPTFAELGLIVPTGGVDKDGHPAYRVGGMHFQMTKVELGPMKVVLTGGGQGQQSHQPAQQPQQGTQQPRQQAQTPQQGNEPVAVRVARLNATMTACVKAAILAWKEAIPGDGTFPPVDYGTIGATASCLFIQRSRDNLLSPPPKGTQQGPPPATPERKQELAKLSSEIGLNLDEFIKANCHGKSAADLTEPEAVQLAATLRRELEVRAEARRQQEAAQEQPQADLRGDAYEPSEGLDF